MLPVETKRQRINMISAISSQGKVRFMVYQDTMNQQRLIRFMQRLVNPKFCVNSIWVQIEQNLFRAVAVESGCCHVNNITRVGSDVKWEEEQFILPLTSGHGGVTRAYARQSRWPFGHGSGSSPAAVQSTFS